jgi:hypothetical protein
MQIFEKLPWTTRCSSLISISSCCPRLDSTALVQINPIHRFKNTCDAYKPSNSLYNERQSFMSSYSFFLFPKALSVSLLPPPFFGFLLQQETLLLFLWFFLSVQQHKSTILPPFLFSVFCFIAATHRCSNFL